MELQRITFSRSREFEKDKYNLPFSGLQDVRSSWRNSKSRCLPVVLLANSNSFSTSGVQLSGFRRQTTHRGDRRRPRPGDLPQGSSTSGKKKRGVDVPLLCTDCSQQQTWCFLQRQIWVKLVYLANACPPVTQPWHEDTDLGAREFEPQHHTVRPVFKTCVRRDSCALQRSVRSAAVL